MTGSKSGNNLYPNPPPTDSAITSNSILSKCFIVISPFLKFGFVSLIEYHNHTHISIKFPLNFFLPLLCLALLSVILSAIVLKLPLKVIPGIADYLGKS